MPPGVPGYLEKLLQNPRFAGAERISRFLRFVVGKTLAGEAAEIKETLIATEVYGRRPDYDPRADSIVRVEASRLRAKLRDYYDNEGAGDPIRLELPKGSYVPVFTEVPVDHPAVPSDPPPLRHHTAWMVLAGLGAAGLCALTFFLWRPRPATPETIPSVTVLPFDNLTGRPALSAFSTGFADEVAAGLGRAGSLRVAGRQAEDRNRASGKEESFLLEGSIRADSAQLRIIAELVARSDGYQVWSRSFDAGQSQSLDEQARLAQEIAASVAGVVADLHHKRASQWSAEQRQAYQLYSRARQQMGGFDVLLTHGADMLVPPSLAELTSVAALYNQALALNPGLAQAHAGLAWVYLDASDHDPGMIVKARESAQRALTLDANAAEAYAVLGYNEYLNEWDFEKAEQHLGLALSLQFRTPHWLRLYSEVAAIRGNLDQAVRKLNEGAAALPDSLTIRMAQGMLAYQRHDWRAALSTADFVLRKKPDYALAYWLRGLALEQSGQPAPALAAFDSCLLYSPGDPRCIPARGYNLARQGHRAEAVDIINSIRLRTSPLSRSPFSIALIRTGLQDYSQALDALESAYELHDRSLPFLAVDPRLVPLAGQPRFQAIQRKMKLR